MPKSGRAAPGRVEDRWRASALFYIPTLVPWAARASLLALHRTAVTCVVLFLFPSAAGALPPRPPSAAKTRDAIRQLKLAAPLSMRGYNRDLFPHWISQGDGCDTRDRVLIRDGRDVSVGSDCRISGAWRSFYDGQTVTSSSRVDIDHVVPLANAWRSGAKRWSRERRRRLANDLDNSQLIAVSASSNRSKGDQGPESWKPPRRAAWCLYSRWWVQVKRAWRLTVIRPERTELRKMVATC
jgi:Protein of unknown function (DUF1524)